MQDNKIKQVVTNGLYSFLNEWSWREMLKDVIDPEEKNQRKEVPRQLVVLKSH
jgi:hypothetical protein